MPSAVREGFPWPTVDPFLFCVHHLDRYPKGNDRLGPVASLAGRNLGQDFTVRDGFRMYHGQTVPGFPSHPHRGFETVTVVRRGFVDHSDSLGATARYGGGDVQWLTAGAGIQHAEMFPLTRPDADNTLELFQIWLNLPAVDKMAQPHFAMLWAEDVPVVEVPDERGLRTVVTIAAGSLGGARPPPPPPSSWAARASSEVAIWTIEIPAGGRFALPAAPPGAVRTLYFFAGDRLAVGDHDQRAHAALSVASDAPLPLVAGDAPAQLLLLQGRPIGEAVAHYGPFVMNTESELRQAFADYRRTQFGGWPWTSSDPVHGREAGRFARRADGTVERPRSA
jgi:redox-sensitive bicupin YhaK (pirin superfamily)